MIFIPKVKMYLFFSSVLIFALCFNLSITVAQPSGGPYGPIQKKYELPKVPGNIYYVSVDGKAEQLGESINNPTTIESAIAKVKTGDAIVLRGGTYRTGNLILNQGITIQPYKNEQPIFKGSYIADGWKNLGNGLWTTKWKYLFPSKPDNWWRRNREGKKTPLYRFNNDMVFVDGKFLQAVGWEGEVNKNTYYIDYNDSLVYIGINPTNKLVEITAFNVAILRTTKETHGKKSDHKGYTIKGVTFSQYAYRALEIEGNDPVGLSPESAHGKEVIGTTLEDCTISFCSRVAGYLRGDSLKIIHCKISDTSTEGIYILGSSDVLLEKNIFTRNNIEHITGYYPAAVKIFDQCYRVTCKDNLIIDLPNSNGVWYDVGNVDGVFINNWVQNVGHITKEINTNQLWPSDNGFFFEISKGVTCAGNVFVNCDHGMMILNSSNAKIYQNTFVNSIACIGRNGRTAKGDHFGWHPSTGPDIDKRNGHIFVNNLLFGDKNFERPLLFTWQTDTLCNMLPNPMLKEIDHNVYIRQAAKSSYPLILWSPANNQSCQAEFNSINELNKIYPDFSKKSQTYMNYNGPIFKGIELGNYQTVSTFPGNKYGMKLPVRINKLIGNSKSNEKYVGAYPPVILK